MRVVKGFFRSRTRSEAPGSANWDWAGKARSKCVTDVGHKVQLPLGPSTRLCLETIRYKRGHNVLPPLGPSTRLCLEPIRYKRGHNVLPPLGSSTGRLSEKLGFVEVLAPPLGELARRMP